MIEDPIMMGAALFGIAGVFVVGGVGLALLANRRARPKLVVPIFDEAPADLVLKPWSETRGFYFFRAADIPKEVADLFAGRPDGVFREFGENEAEALAALNMRLRLKAIEGSGKLPPLVTASSVAFKPLNKRKASTP